MRTSGSRSAKPLAAAALVVLCGCLAAVPLSGAHFDWDQNHDPFQTQAPPPPDGNQPACNPAASPFEAASGNYFYEFEDFSANVVGPELRFARTYNSRDQRKGPLGVGWTHTYDVRLLDLTDGVSISALCRKGTGKRYLFQRNPDGSYAPPADFFSQLTQLPDGTFSLSEADGTVKWFDTDGLLTAITDRDGNQLSLAYDATGFLTLVTDAAGAQIVLTKGADGRVASVTDPKGRFFQYAYDAEGRLASVTNPLNESTTFAYGADGKLAQILDSLGRTVQDLGYDNDGRLNAYIENGVPWTVDYSPVESKTTKTNPLGESWEIYYNENGNVVRRVDPLGGEQLFDYDSSYRLVAATDESGAETTYTHDQRGNIATQTNALGHTTAWVYDPADGSLLSVTNPDDQTTSYTFENGRLSRVEDEEGLLFRLEYYPDGRLHRRIDPNGQATVLVYNPQGLLQSITSPEGGQGTFEYDAAGNTTAEIDPDGRREEFDYDGLNRLKARRDPDGNEVSFEYAPVCPVCPSDRLMNRMLDASGRETRWEYDQFGRLVKTILPDLTEIELTYDQRGEVATQVERDETVTLFSYDAVHRLETMEEPGGVIWAATYDGGGRLERLLDPEGEETRFSYDALGRLIGTTTAATGEVAVTYTAADVLATRTDARGVHVRYGRDGRGRLVTESFPDVQENILYHRDEAASDNGGGRLTSIENAIGTTRFHYDGDGRLKRLESTIDAVVYSTRYDYAPSGLIAGVTYPSGLEVLYNRDGRGLVETIEVDRAGVRTVIASAISHDPEGRLLSLTFGNGLQESRGYDAAGQVDSITVPGIDEVAYGRDLRGNVTQVADQLDPSRNRLYVYDDLARLTGATGPWGSRTYTYDRAGNRLTRTDAAGTATYQYDGNRLTSISGAETASYTYDAAGNVLSNGTRDFAYSQAGRLAAVVQGGIETARYRYQASNQRALRESDAGEAVYTYDLGGRLIEALDTSSNGVVSYIYLEGWRPLAQVVDGEIQAIHVDHLGTPKVLTDDMGSEVWRGEFYPFGEPYQETGPAAQRLGFPGQVRDPEAGLSYNWYRWYESATGRYTRVDPLGLHGEPHPYNYATSRPTTLTDPSGLAAQVTCYRCRDTNGPLGCRVTQATPSYPSPFFSQSPVFVANQGQNDPSKTPGDPFGSYGPMPPGSYNLPNGWSRKFQRRLPSPTNNGSPGQINTPLGTFRNGLRFHAGMWSQGCIVVGSRRQENQLTSLVDQHQAIGGTTFVLIDVNCACAVCP